jgi:putative FmdB family regulatory protein
MPLYEYQCETCCHRFERIQKFSDPLVDVCPSCGGKVRKLLSSPAIQFKGSGWYITDYAKKSASKDDGKGSASTSTGESAAPEKTPAASSGTSSTSTSQGSGGSGTTSGSSSGS